MSSIEKLLTTSKAVMEKSLKILVDEGPATISKFLKQFISGTQHTLTQLESLIEGAYHHFLTIFILNILAPIIHLGIISIFVMIALLWTPYYYLTLIYAVWWIIDYDTCDTGKRRIEWLRGNLFGHVYKYFQYSLIYDGPELDIEQNYVAGYHPHGIFPVGSGLAFGLNPPELPFSRDFKRWHMAHSFLFRVPILREILLSFGTRAASERAIDHILKHSGKGNIMAIVPGGLAEMMLCSKGKLYLKLKGRYGFVRKAIETGSHLLPCLGFGETELLNHKVFPKGHFVDIVQTFCRKTFNFNLPFAYGDWFGFPGFQPNKVRLTVCVGSPVEVVKNADPTPEEIERVHGVYVKELTRIFYKYREQFADHDYDFEIR